jgi:hypothetical protein
MRRLLVTLAAVLPLAVHAQEGGPAGAPTGLTVTASLGAGGELGLQKGKAGVFELEGAVGYEFSNGMVRPELAIALGVAPDDNVAIRPGVRVALPNLPISLRASLDASTSRGASGLDWRWLLLGVAAEVRWTSLLGLFVEVDTGFPLSSSSGLPLLLRAGTSFRF